MQGAIRKPKLGYGWMRVGFAGPRFKTGALALFVCAVVALALWAWLEMPAGPWRLPRLMGGYILAALLYLNLGVWLHEQLHCLPYRGTAAWKRVQIFYVRSYLTLNGHYRVRGPIGYRTLQRALLGPLILVAVLVALASLAGLLLPAWWLPFILTIAAVALMDMLHDLYWLTQIRLIGESGKYWDNGRELEVVWRRKPVEL